MAELPHRIPKPAMLKPIPMTLLALNLLAFPSPAATMKNLSVEFRQNPLGVDVEQPRLGWNMISKLRGERQSAYQVLVASSPELLAKNQGDLWDTKQVKSDLSNQLPYGGKPLRSNQLVWWKVRVWDKNGAVSAWSSAAQWTMGLLNEADWMGASWISAPEAIALAAAPARGRVTSPGLLLRREFATKSGLKRALLHVSGLGNYTPFINGQKASGDVLEPGWTNYRKTVLYQSYDVTALVKSGAPNAIGLSLGHGMYDISGAPDGRYVKFRQSFGPLQAIAQLRLQYEDGSSEIIGTDIRWKTSPGPLTFENLFAGEDYDARLEIDGWDEPNLRDETKWTSAIAAPSPGGAMRSLSSAAPPIRAHDRLQPVKITSPKPGVAVYDFGQNTAMMPRLEVRGAAGAMVRMIPAELLGKDGLVDRNSSTQDGVRPAWWQYTLRGAGNEMWMPQFFYHGSRYLQVETTSPTGTPAPIIEKLESVVVHSSSTPIGKFETSNELFNRTHALVRWAQRSNMMSVMTDCPHREKMPWLEETHLNGPSLRYNFEMAPLLAKTTNDMADSQLENGFVPNIAPEFFKAQPRVEDPFRNSPEWGSAFLLVPWQQYQFTGDTSLLRRHYEGMKRYVAFLESTAKDHIVSTGLGDWYDIGPKPSWGSQLTPPPLTATAFYYYDNWILARVAALLGKPEEAATFEAKSLLIRDAFNAKFFNPETGQYATGSQTSNAIPLVMELAKPEHRAGLLEAIVKDVQQKGLTSGDVGYRYLLRALADGGRSDVIYAMNNQSDKPGYGMQLARGATSLTEKWDASVGNFGSQNHFMLGQINEWFFHDLAGIQCDPTVPGFKKIIIKPAIVGDLKMASASYDSSYGRIESRWTREGNQLTLRVSIPANTSATVYMPAIHAALVREGGELASESAGVKVRGMEGGVAVFELGAGDYSFSSSVG